jgi:ferrous iron transport protein A
MTVPMSDLRRGQRGEVLALTAYGNIRRRLLDLGLVPGTVIERLMTSPIGDPICFRVRGAMIALRCEDANMITVTI